MLPYETQVASYIERTGNSVLYKVTPDFRDNELMARGVRIQAQSVDSQDGFFCCLCLSVRHRQNRHRTRGRGQRDTADARPVYRSAVGDLGFKRLGSGSFFEWHDGVWVVGIRSRNGTDCRRTKGYGCTHFLQRRYLDELF